MQNVWICRKINCVELRKFNKKLCTLKVRNVRIWREIEYTKLRKLKKKFEHYICTKCLYLQKNWISRTSKIQQEIVYIIYIRNVWICRKIESPELRKFNGRLFTLYMYGISGFAEKLNIQHRGNSTGNCVRYMYGMSGFAEKLNVQTTEIQREIVYIIFTEYLDL